MGGSITTGGEGEGPEALPGDQKGPEDERELQSLAYEELRRLAHRAMAQQLPGHTLQTTALLNEAWLRLEQARGARWDGRDHFLAVAASAMRSVLVDHARSRGAQKRGGGRARVDLTHVVELHEERSGDLLSLDEALKELNEVDPALARIVELRFFGGLKHPAIAQVLGMSLRQVERGWATARGWLYARLAESEEED